MAAAVALTVAVVGAANPLPVAAAPAALDLEMVPGTGQLLVRDAEETYPLATPTTVAGTIDTGPGGTGQITGATFSSAPLEFSAEVLDGQAIADVVATFEQVGSGSATGAVDSSGNMALATAVDLDLHIEVRDTPVVGDCSTGPVELDLRSTSPYSADTEEVTLADADFSIPAFAESPTCAAIIVQPLNELLAGSGHSLTLTLEGAIELPPPPVAASATTLVVSPTGEVDHGSTVTLTATVVSDDPEEVTVPDGQVEFFDGPTSLGSADLDPSGVASLLTTTVQIGTRPLGAEYSGSAVYGPSVSDPVTLVIRPTPTIQAEVPPFVVRGAAAVELPVTIENPAQGRVLANVGVRVIVRRVGSTRPFNLNDLSIQQRLSGSADWAAVTLSNGPGSRTVSGLMGPATGRALLAGATVEDILRLAYPLGTTPLSDFTATFELVQLDSGTGTVTGVIATTTKPFTLVPLARATTTVNLGAGITPAVVRAGNSLIMSSVQVTASEVTAPLIGGSLSVLIDGLPVPVWASSLGVEGEPAESIPLAVPMPLLVVDTPASLTTGEHTLTLRYGGNANALPSSADATFTVAPAVARQFLCVADALGSVFRFGAQVSARANVPSVVAAGQPLDLNNLDIEMTLDRSDYSAFQFQDVVSTTGTPAGPGTTIPSVVFDFGANGTGTATSVTRTGEVQTDPSDMEPDFRLAFGGETAQLSVDGEAGASVSVGLESLSITLEGFPGFALAYTCTPYVQASMGTTTLAGTNLTTDGPSPVRADDVVGLTATVLPASTTGQVRFYDGADLVAVSTIAAGSAHADVELDEGVHSLTARTLPSGSGPSTTSEAVVVDVAPAVECAEFAQPGDGAAVRLVYLELLGRCPDRAGFDHWVAALDDGDVTREGFAGQISASLEAREVIVDDAYRLMLGRPADAAGREFWARRLANGRFDALLADLAASSEFRGLAGGTNEGFVDRVYEQLLGRAADPDGRWYWMFRLSSGVSRRQLVLTLANLAEPLSVLVEGAYADILGRTPTSREQDSGVVMLRSSSNRSQLYAALIGTSGFFTRAQDFPNPED